MKLNNKSSVTYRGTTLFLQAISLSVNGKGHCPGSGLSFATVMYAKMSQFGQVEAIDEKILYFEELLC